MSILYYIGCIVSFFLFSYQSFSVEGRKNIREKNIGCVALFISLTICTILSWFFVGIYVYEIVDKIGGEK